MDFLFILFLIGILIATFQDLKRREVDNWVNLSLILISVSYFLFVNPPFIWLMLGFLFILMYFLSNILYYSRVFAGGDAKLLFAMTVLFIGVNFYESFLNIGAFVVLLMFSGSVYGLLFSLFVYSKNYDKVNKKIVFGSKKLWFRYFIISGIVLFVLSYVNIWFLFPAILIFGYPLLYFFAKGLEEVTMIKSVDGKNLRQGDWLLEDIKIGKKIIRANWEGLKEDEIALLKNRKKVKIKDGLPFVPAFLIAFVAYYLFKERLILFLLNIA